MNNQTKKQSDKRTLDGKLYPSPDGCLVLADSVEGSFCLIKKRSPSREKEHVRRWQKMYRMKNPSYVKRKYARKKKIGGVAAESRVRDAIKKGILPSLSKNFIKCTDCSNRAVNYDHRDYGRPLDVSPVCIPCNIKRGPAIPKKGEG